MKQNILKIRGNTLIFDGFEKIKKDIIISFIYNSIVIYPIENQKPKINQMLCSINENRLIINIEFANKIKNHLKKELKDDIDLYFIDSPIYTLNLNSYILLPSKQKLPKE